MAAVFLVSPEEKARVLTYGECPYTMYYLRDRVDALTTFIPALVEEVNYVLECLVQYLQRPSKELARRISLSTFSCQSKPNPNEANNEESKLPPSSPQETEEEARDSLTT